MVGFQEEARQINIYLIEITPEAGRALSAIGKANQRLIVDAINALDYNPRPSNSKMLVASENLRRLTVGDYRVIYGISESRQIVTVELIRHRSRAYMLLAAFALTVRSKKYSR